jgi:RNA polymerase sigma-70 factor (ECF subfamily)
MIGKRRALEELLVVEARTGDRAAIEALVRLRGPRLLVHATRLLGDRDQAQDAVQEAWVEILRGLPALRAAAAFPAWSTQIVTRRCARIIKGLQKGRALAAELTPLLEVEQPEPDDEAARLRWAIDQLPAEQAATIALFYLEDMRLAEVAIALDIPQGTVKSRLSKARGALRALLEGEGDDHEIH